MENDAQLIIWATDGAMTFEASTVGLLALNDALKEALTSGHISLYWHSINSGTVIITLNTSTTWAVQTNRDLSEVVEFRKTDAYKEALSRLLAFANDGYMIFPPTNGNVDLAINEPSGINAWTS